MKVQFVPELAGIVQLFSRVPTAASLWLHLLSINLFAARWIMFDGPLSLLQGTCAHKAAHSVRVHVGILAICNLAVA